MGWVIDANPRLGRRQNLNGFRLLPVEARHVPIANSDQTIAAAELLVEVGERHAGISEGALWRFDASGNSGPPGIELFLARPERLVDVFALAARRRGLVGGDFGLRANYGIFDGGRRRRAGRCRQRCKRSNH